MIVFSIVSTKGGVGKTTFTGNFGALLADLGMRVLLIDADVQPSLSRYFPLRHQAPFGLTEMIKRGVITPDCISSISLHAENNKKMPSLNPDGCLDIVLSDAPEGTLQDWLSPRIDRAVRIKQALKSPLIHENYDVVLIDTQGAVGHLQDAAVLAADVLISPVSPDILSAREFTGGTQELLERLEPSSSAIGVSFPQMKAIIYKLENTVDSKSIAKAIRDKFVSLRGRVTVLNSFVPASTVYKKAATAQLPVHWVDPQKACQTMHQLCWELIPSLDGIYAGICNQEETSSSVTAETREAIPAA